MEGKPRRVAAQRLARRVDRKCRLRLASRRVTQNVGHGKVPFAGAAARSDGFGPLLAMQWVIVGGESGAGWRPMDPEWARYLRNRCREFEIPFFFKQVSGLHPTDGMIPKDLRIREYPHVSMVV